MTTKSKLAVMALGLALLGAAASVAQAQTRERVVYGLSWLPQAEHCGFFQARETGLYAAAGLNVELVPGGPGINTAQLVAAGRYHYAMGTALTTLNMRSNSVPGVTIAALFQKSPQTLVAHPGQGITKLEDLKTRRISVANFSRTQFWAWLKASHGFDDANLRPYTYNPSLFVADPSTVQQGFITEDAFFLGKALGAEPVSLLLADYGYPDYQTTIFTTDAEIVARPTVAQRFVDATDLTGFSWTRLIEIISLERNPGRCPRSETTPNRSSRSCGRSKYSWRRAGPLARPAKRRRFPSRATIDGATSTAVWRSNRRSGSRSSSVRTPD